MKILFLAPMPIYQERGSPIAVKMALEVLSQRGYEVDAVAFHEGQDFPLPHVTLYRTPSLPFIRNIRPGFSFKKLICDIFLSFMALKLALSNRYQLVYAVEESVFMALVLRVLLRLPYVYDMDSSLAQQMVEKYPVLKIIAPILNGFEGLAVKHAEAVVPVCDALAAVSAKYRPRRLTVLYDVPQLGEVGSETSENLRQTLDITGPLLMYVGNLEAYQGIDLLLQSFALALPQLENANLVIIGGAQEHIRHYGDVIRQLGIERCVHLIGPRPVSDLSSYLTQADVLVSPRIKGINTPMKVYSYLASGKPILATNLTTHTQVLNSRVAVLAHPTPMPFAKGMIRIVRDENLRNQLAANGPKLIADKHNYAAFFKTFNGLFRFFHWFKDYQISVIN
jgi:glycosyltransferase involved in cell wall biosynthesis